MKKFKPFLFGICIVIFGGIMFWSGNEVGNHIGYTDGYTDGYLIGDHYGYRAGYCYGLEDGVTGCVDRLEGDNKSLDDHIKEHDLYVDEINTERENQNEFYPSMTEWNKWFKTWTKFENCGKYYDLGKDTGSVNEVYHSVILCDRWYKSIDEIKSDNS